MTRLFAFADDQRIVLVTPDRKQLSLSRAEARALLDELRHLLATPLQRTMENTYARIRH